MNLSPRIRKFIGTCCALLMLSVATLPAQAAMVGTDQVLEEARAEMSRAEMVQMFERDAVRSELTAMGVDPDAAQERVARMTDAEIAELQGRIGDLPAGGSVLGAVLVIFIVFIITDALGATDIFPFVDPIN